MKFLNERKLFWRFGLFSRQPFTSNNVTRLNFGHSEFSFEGEDIICGLRNGTIEIWNKRTLQRELTLSDQEGSVQVDANDEIVVGVSSDSTICVWSRKTGDLIDVLYHHRASVWGVRLRGNSIITGSMDGTISVVDSKTLKVRKHFLAHEGEWGISDIDADNEKFVSGCFDGFIHVWRLTDCEKLRTIDAGHAVNCVSVRGQGVVSSSRTGKQHGFANVILWDVTTGDKLLQFDGLSSCCFAQLDNTKLVTLVSAGDNIIGEHHLIKWPIAKVVIQSPKKNSTKYERRNSNLWDEIVTKKSSQMDACKLVEKNEYLLRYLRTPSVCMNETLLVYYSRRGICSVVDFWPTMEYSKEH